MGDSVDPIALAVVQGALETTQREMTVSLEKTARSSVFNLAHDFSNALFNQRSVDMRYVGQVHECTVAIDTMNIDSGSIGKVIDAFHQRHEELFTYSEPDSPVELVNLESAIYGRVDKPSPPRIEGGVGPDEAVKEMRDMVFSADGSAVAGPVYNGAVLRAGSVVEGPAIIEEDTTTIVIEPSWRAELDLRGTYVLTPAG